MEMKADVARLPAELAKMSSVSIQLKMDEISTISKLAKGIAPVSRSVITQGPSSTQQVPPSVSKIAKESVSANKSHSPKPHKDVVVVSDKVFLDKPQQPTKYKVTYTSSTGQTGPQVQLPPGQGLAMQTPEGLVVYTVPSSVNGSQAVSVVQANSTEVTTTSASQTYAIGVPTYLDGSNIYQTVQLVPAVSGQQVVYWPPVAGTGQTPAQVTTVAAAPGPAGTVRSQLAMVGLQRGTQAVIQPVQFSVESPTGKETSQNSVITID